MTLSDSWVMPVLAVDDLDRASGFYRDTLGFSIQRLDDDPSVAIVEVGHGYLLLYESSFRRGETTVASFVVQDVESTVRELRERGVTFEDYDLPGLKTENGIATMGEMRTAWFKDSEGNVIAINNELTQYLRKAA